MTNGTPLNVIESFFYAGQWYHPGQKFPPAGTDVPAELVTRYTGTYLLSDGDLTRRENPQAHQAQTELTRVLGALAEAQGEVAAVEPLLALFAGEDGTPATPEQALGAARTLQQEAKVLREVLGDEPQETLRALQADRQALALAQQQLATLRALHPTAPGTELPTSFLRRGALAKFGLTTYESLLGKTAAQLDAIEGVGAEQAEKIVTLVATWEAKQAELKAGTGAGAEAQQQGDATQGG